jgi:hypothetical protein
MPGNDFHQSHEWVRVKAKTNWYLKFFSYGKSSSSVRFQSLYNTGCSINLLRMVQLNNRDQLLCFATTYVLSDSVTSHLSAFYDTLSFSRCCCYSFYLEKKTSLDGSDWIANMIPPLYGFFHRRMLLKEIWSTNLIEDGWDCQIFFPCDLWIAIDFFDKLPVLWISACMSSTLAEDKFAPTQKTASLLFVKNYRSELSYAGTRLSKVTVGLVAALVGAWHPRMCTVNESSLKVLPHCLQSIANTPTAM